MANFHIDMFIVPVTLPHVNQGPSLPSGDIAGEGDAVHFRNVMRHTYSISKR